MRFSVSSNIDEVLGWTARLHPQFQFACAKALTDTAKQAQAALYAEMDVVWDRPTPFSKRSLFISPAIAPVRLEASVKIKDYFPGKASLSPQQLYEHQYFGGVRARKGSEKYFEKAGLISASESMAPSSGARFDAYGNVTRSMMIQIMSQLRLGLDPYAWKTESAKSKANRKRSGEFFWSRGGHLSRGVWMRRGRGVVQVLKVVSAGHVYQARMNMGRVSTLVFESQFGRNLEAAFAKSKATAR